MSDQTTPRVARDFMTTKEVAEYLRIKERRVYELVRRQEIPCTRVTGKWLFPRALVDLWLAEHAGGAATVPAPPVIAKPAGSPFAWRSQIRSPTDFQGQPSGK